MEWLKQPSLRKSLSVIIIISLAAGLAVFMATMLIHNSISATCICQTPLYYPLLFGLAVIFPILAAAFFYRIKLKAPLAELDLAAKRIMENDLDFSIRSGSGDELGRLCGSFESMRAELLKNNRKMWQQVEERKRLNAAFAHDLRNPVTVLKGSANMLQQGLRQSSLTSENAGESISLIVQYAERIENYISSMTSVQKLEELVFVPKEASWPALAGELEYSLSILCEDAGKEVVFSAGGAGNDRIINIDKNIIQNVAENLTDNAQRHAKSSISIDMFCDDEKVTLCVSDDGPGFSEKVLAMGAAPFLCDDSSEKGQNFGMGLYICHILCEKHGGRLVLENNPDGAKATAEFYF